MSSLNVTQMGNKVSCCRASGSLSQLSIVARFFARECLNQRVLVQNSRSGRSLLYDTELMPLSPFPGLCITDARMPVVIREVSNCPFLIFCTNSMPLIVTAAFPKFL